MQKKKGKLLLICKDKFGGLVDSLKWCEYLRDEYRITYVGYSEGHKVSEPMPGVHDVSMYSRMPRALRGSLYLAYCIIRCLFHRGPIIVVFFPKCDVIKRALPWRKMNLDIRTLAVSHDKDRRDAFNSKLLKACRSFDTVTAISQGVADQLGIKDAKILPLGADVISSAKRDYTSAIHLLYVGTFVNRDLHKTLQGLAIFVKNNPDVKVTYTMIGDGKNGEHEQLKELASQLGLENIVTFAGRQPYDKLPEYFDSANVGVSFVPITDFYQDQPPTKTYEYIMSGLYCLATNTKSNAAIVNSDNGCLIDDSPEAFAKALEEYTLKAPSIDQQQIMASLPGCSWREIVNQKLKPIIKNL